MFQRLAQAFHVSSESKKEHVPIVTRRKASVVPVFASVPAMPSTPVEHVASTTTSSTSFSDQRKAFVQEEEAKRKQLLDRCAMLPAQQDRPVSMALTGFSDAHPTEHQESHRDGDVIKMYQRATRPPLQRGVVRQGRATVEQVFQEAPVTDRPIAQLEQGRTLQTPLTRVPYQMCSDVPHQVPLDMACLQLLFLETGGKVTGTMYPSVKNWVWYQTLGTLNDVRHMWAQTQAQAASLHSPHQQEAMVRLFGPPSLPARAPYVPGIEAFWFVKEKGKVVGFLGRTIETNMTARHGSNDDEAVLYVTDLRVKTPVSATFHVRSKGFWLFLNQPALMDHDASRHLSHRIPVDLPGLRLDFHDTETTMPIGTGPQLMKFFGAPMDTCSFVASHDVTYSLACDMRAPFLTFEVDPVSRTFQELRNPGLFAFCVMRSLEMYTRTEERMTVPEQKGFARLSASSGIHLPNIHAGCWRTLSIAFRMISMPIKETFFHIRGAPDNGQGTDPFFSVVLTTINGSTATMRLEERDRHGKTRVVPTPYRLGVNHWYIMVIQQTSEGMRIQLVLHGQPALEPVYAIRQESLFGSRLCNVSLGAQAPSASLFEYDVAWIHLYDYLWGCVVPPS